MLRTGEMIYRGSPTFLDYTDKETLDNLPSPRVFASHMTFDFMPKQVKEGKGKVIAIFRNPKDILASLQTFYDKIEGKIKTFSQFTWSGLLKFHMEGTIYYGSWFDYIQSWDKIRREHEGRNIMYLMYEVMIQDLSSHVRKLALFLGVSSGSDFLDKITARCTFSNMAEEATKSFAQSEQWNNITNDKKFPIYRKGVIGDWKNNFTVAQSEHFSRVYDEKMKNSSFEFRFV